MRRKIMGIWCLFVGHKPFEMNLFGLKKAVFCKRCHTLLSQEDIPDELLESIQPEAEVRRGFI